MNQNIIPLREKCELLKPILGRKIDYLWLVYTTATSLEEKAETESMINFLYEKQIYKGKLDTKNILLTPPSEKEAKGRGEIHIGDVAYLNKKLYPFYLNLDEIRRGAVITGKTQKGKTTLCQNILLGLIEHDIPFTIFDRKRGYRDILSLKDNEKLKSNPRYKEIIKKIDNIQIYTIGRNIAPLDGNIFYKPKNIHMLSWVAGPVSKSFETKLLGGQGSNSFLVEGVKKMLKQFQGKVFNILDLKQDLDWQNPRGRQLLWHQTMQRIYTFLGLEPIADVFSSKNPVKKEELMKSQVIIEIDEAFPEDLANLFISLHVYFVILYWLQKGEYSKLRYVTVLEEAHNFFGTDYFNNQGKEDIIERLFRQISGFGVGIITITQLPHLLPATVTGNACVQIQLGIQHVKDLIASRESFGLKREQEEFFQMLDIGEGIVTVDGRIKPCSVKFSNLPIERGTIKDEVIKKRHEKNNLVRNWNS